MVTARAPGARRNPSASSRSSIASTTWSAGAIGSLLMPGSPCPTPNWYSPSATAKAGWSEPGRSEERRVGKECRSRWSPEHQKKKEKKGGRPDRLAGPGKEDGRERHRKVGH